MDIPAHLDLRNPHSFEMKDLENLIKKVSNKTSWLDFDMLTMTHMLTKLEMLMVAEMSTLAENEMQTEI